MSGKHVVKSITIGFLASSRNQYTRFTNNKTHNMEGLGKGLILPLAVWVLFELLIIFIDNLLHGRVL